MNSLTRPNATCPRFVSIDFSNAGLGDQLTRLIYLYTVAQRRRLTAIVDMHYGVSSMHSRGGYKNIYDKLGFPTNPLNETGVLNLYQNLSIAEISLDRLVLSDELAIPCGTLIQTRIFSCRGGWCPQSLSHFVEILSRPIVDSLSNARAADFRQRVFPLKDAVINIVWHVRTGDICLRCDDRQFFRNVFNFLKKSVKWYSFQNIVVHLPDKRVSRLFSSIPNTVFWTEPDEEASLKLFFNADILIATGSSFPIIAGWLTPINKPIMLISERKEHFWLKADLIQGSLYDLSEGRAIRLDGRGQVLNYNHLDLFHLLSVTSVLLRMNITHVDDYPPILQKNPNPLQSKANLFLAVILASVFAVKVLRKKITAY